MHHKVKVVIKLLSFDDGSCPYVEDYELPFLSKREDKFWGKNELNDWLRMTRILQDLIHFLPLHNSIVIQSCINMTILRGLNPVYLVLNKARHIHQVKFGSIIDIEGMISNRGGQQDVLVTLEYAKGYAWSVVPQWSVWLEEHWFSFRSIISCIAFS